MATRDSTSKARPGRKRSTASRKSRSAAGPVVSNSIPQAVEDAIEAERTRLMTAHTLLSCAALAMDAEDIAFDGPHYLTVLELSRDLVNEAINNLEPMALETTGQAGIVGDELDDDELDFLPRGKQGVREPVTAYWTH